MVITIANKNKFIAKESKVNLAIFRPKEKISIACVLECVCVTHVRWICVHATKCANQFSLNDRVRFCGWLVVVIMKVIFLFFLCPLVCFIIGASILFILNQYSHFGMYLYINLLQCIVLFKMIIRSKLLHSETQLSPIPLTTRDFNNFRN